MRNNKKSPALKRETVTFQKVLSRPDFPEHDCHFFFSAGHILLEEIRFAH